MMIDPVAFGIALGIPLSLAAIRFLTVRYRNRSQAPAEVIVPGCKYRLPDGTIAVVNAVGNDPYAFIPKSSVCFSTSSQSRLWMRRSEFAQVAVLDAPPRPKPAPPGSVSVADEARMRG
jgi:hypothetical protein